MTVPDPGTVVPSPGTQYRGHVSRLSLGGDRDRLREER
jgi:hypothetical protein